MRVGIVGGGFSGLMSAFLLESTFGREADIVILEASDRLGGRIKTELLNGSEVPYDSGAAELYEITGSYSMKALVDSLGLIRRSLTATPTFAFEGRLLRCEADFKRALGQSGIDSLARFWTTAASMRTVEQYASAGHPHDNSHPWFKQRFSETLDLIDDAKARAFTEMQVHSDVGTEPENTTGLFGVDNLLIDHPDYADMFSIIGGNEGLITALSRRLSAEILLNKRVERISATTDGKYEILFGAAQTAARLVVDYLIVTPPPMALSRISWDPRTLENALHRHIRHHDHPATYTRATLLLHEPAWKAELPEDYFVCDALGGMTAYDKSLQGHGSQVPIISLLASGKDAVALLSCSEEEALGVFLLALPEEARIKRASVKHFRINRWTGELGVSRMPGGSPLLPLGSRHLPSPEHSGLFVVGDYLYDATINGALDACLCVVKYISDIESGSEVESLDSFANRYSFLQIAQSPTRISSVPGTVLPFLKTPRSRPMCSF